MYVVFGRGDNSLAQYLRLHWHYISNFKVYLFTPRFMQYYELFLNSYCIFEKGNHVLTLRYYTNGHVFFRCYSLTIFKIFNLNLCTCHLFKKNHSLFCFFIEYSYSLVCICYFIGFSHELKDAKFQCWSDRLHVNSGASLLANNAELIVLNKASIWKFNQRRK